MTAGALAYPIVWLALLVLGFRVALKGWSRGRAVATVACLVAIPWLAVVLAREDWFFSAATR